MRYCFVALDLDGTLLDKNHQVTDESAEYLRYLQSRGFQVAIATGRSFSGVRDAVKKLNFDQIPVVCANGSMGIMAKIARSNISLGDEKVCINEEILFHLPVERSATLRTIEVANSLGHVVQYYHGDDIYANASNDFHYEITKRYKALTGVHHVYIDDNFKKCLEAGLPSKILVMCGENGLDDTLKNLQEAHENDDNVYITRGNGSGWFVEVLCTNKGKGFEKLCETLKVEREKTVAFGDGFNDIEFIQSAGLGIAMKNAVAALKEVADEDCEWFNYEEGVKQKLAELERRGLLLFKK